MQEWQARPVEVANLFNPAFCGVVLSRAVDGYSETRSEGLPFGLAFLVLPVVLHERTRRSLPRDIRTSFLAWIEDHQEHRIGFADRVRRMRPVTREAIIFSLSHHVLLVGEGGTLDLGEVRVATTPSSLRALTTDAQDCIKRGHFLGRWLGAAGTAPTIMASWGIAP